MHPSQFWSARASAVLFRALSDEVAVCVQRNDEWKERTRRSLELFHKTLQELVTFKRLRPSLDPAAAPRPRHSIILITF